MKRKIGNDYICNIESAEINFSKGAINIESNCYEISENIALAFSISLLHVVCVPVYKGRYGHRDLKTALTLQKFGPQTAGTTRTSSAASTPFNDLNFMKASGILHNTPSNYYMQTYERDRICQMCGWGCPLEFDKSDYKKIIDRWRRTKC